MIQTICFSWLGGIELNLHKLEQIVYKKSVAAFKIWDKESQLKFKEDKCFSPKIKIVSV